MRPAPAPERRDSESDGTKVRNAKRAKRFQAAASSSRWRFRVGARFRIIAIEMSFSPAASGPAPLLADAGGTSIRLARLRAGRVADLRVYAAREFASLEDALDSYLDGERAGAACLAVAGPADRGEAEFQFTNLPWRARWDEIASRFGFSPLAVMNDFAALALGVLELDAGEWIEVGGESEGAGGSGRPVAVIGPGTGMGVASLVGGAAISCEGGHIAFSPQTDAERAIAAMMEAEAGGVGEVGGVGGRVSVERLLSGPGLERIYELHGRARGREIPLRTAGEILDLGLDGGGGVDDDCRMALEIFAGALGAFAGDACLMLGARGGCYVGGGIGRRMAKFLAADAGGFRARFDAKGRLSDYMRRIPVRIVTAEFLAMRGVARRMREVAR